MIVRRAFSDFHRALFAGGKIGKDGSKLPSLQNPWLTAILVKELRFNTLSVTAELVYLFD